jgi:hypothetical protein
MGHSSLQITTNYLSDFSQKAARQGPNPLEKLL